MARPIVTFYEQMAATHLARARTAASLAVRTDEVATARYFGRRAREEARRPPAEARPASGDRPLRPLRPATPSPTEPTAQPAAQPSALAA